MDLAFSAPEHASQMIKTLNFNQKQYYLTCLSLCYI